MQLLKQSTASQEISLGYFLDSTDGDTEETGLTIANTDIKLRKGGGTTLISKNSGGATHISNGIYYATLDATDTNTLGMLEVYVHVSGALANKSTYMVLPSASYDALVTDGLNNLGGTAQTGDSFARLGAPAAASVSADIANVPTTTEISDSVWDESLAAHQTVLSAGRALTLGGVPIAETTAAGTPTTSAIQLTAGSSTDDFYSDQTFKIVGGAAAGQARIITNYIGSTKTCEFDEPLAIAPSNGDAIAIALDHLHSRTQVADSVWSSTTRVLTAGTNLNDLSAAQVNAECDTAISDANLATAAALATVDSNVDAILIDTGTTLPAQITGLNDISTADILASGDVDGYSIEETLKLLGTASYGTLSGAATTTVTITAPDASKARLTATVDADGNRTAVTKDATG